jgi:tetratricopeptide (TPR) repeat protein
VQTPAPKVFVSSTWLDLEPERRAVETVLRRMSTTDFVGMEYFGSRGESTRRASLDEVDRCDIYVGIFAARYGSGITEDEYRRARERGLTCKIYFKSESSITLDKVEKDAAKQARLDELKAELARAHTVSPFTTPEDLASKVVADLHGWIVNEYSPRAAPAPEPAATPGALHQLPAPPRDFTGRKEELDELMRVIERGGATISGLQGQGGVGKTALALKLSELLADRYPDAQFYLDLKGTTQPLTPADAMAHVIRAYHPTAKLPEGLAGLSALYRSVLHGQRALLLMDNARDAAQVEPLIPPAGCTLLVSSRWHFHVPGLVSKDLDELPDEDARALLLTIAPRIGEHAEEIARLCGYLPLALRLAASALAERKDLSPADYARRLADEQHRLKLLGNVEVSLSLSYDLLTPDLQNLWRTLAIFPSTFDLAAAAAIWELEQVAAQDALGELVNYSLLDFDAGDTRYSLHDLAHLSAQNRLSEEERHAALSRHAIHYLGVLRSADELYLQGGEAVMRGFALFDAEWANIRAGQSWAGQHANDEMMARMCSAYPDAGAYVLNLRLHPREQIGWLEQALSAARKTNERHSEGSTLGNLGIAYKNLGETRRAIEVYEQGLEIMREIGDRRGEGNTLINLGIAYTILGETRRAVEFHEQALKVMQEIGDRRGEGNALGNLGNAYADLGETRRAVEFHEQRLAIAREIGDRRGEGNALVNLGNAYADLGETRRAVELYEQQLVITREIGDRRGENTALWNMSLALDALGDRKQAIVYAEASLKIHEEIEDPFADTVRKKLAEWRGQTG